MEIPAALLQRLLNDSAQKLDVKLQLPPDVKQDILGKLQQVKLLQQVATNRFVAQFTSAQTGQQQQLEVTLQPPLPVGTSLTLLAKTATDVHTRQIQLPPKIAQQIQQVTQQVPQQSASPPLFTAQPQRISLPAQSPPITLQQPLPQNLPQQTPLQATIQSVPQTNGEQTLRLTLPPATPQATPQTLTIAAKLPQPLPVGTNLTLLANTSSQQTQLNLTQATLPSGSNLTLPSPPAAAQTVTVNLTTANPEPTLPATARALPIPSNTPQAGTVNQTLELPTGNRITVQTPQPLPANTPINLQAAPAGISATFPAQSAPEQPPLSQFFQGHSLKATLQTDPTTNTINLRLTDGTQLHLHTPQGTANTGAQTVSIQLQADGNVQVFSENTLSANRQDFANLKHALSMLQQYRPDLLPQAQANIPQPHTLLPTLPQMADAMMTLVSERFLGDETVQFLRSIGVDIAPDLQNVQLFQQRTDAPDGWRALLFPFMENPENAHRQGGFFWRKHDQEGDDKGQVRFIMQLNLTQLGIVQLDGLMHKQHIQLKLRTYTETDNAFRQQLRQALYTILTELELTGDIQFQTVETMPFDPMTLLQPSHPARA